MKMFRISLSADFLNLNFLRIENKFSKHGTKVAILCKMEIQMDFFINTNQIISKKKTY